jgi:NAD(P)-dependent dehydrogenase (short-subunit alcohol dehydrogenase family)
MMGEVGQKYGLEADAELSLDDFPTLRHLLDYIVPRIAGGSDEPADTVNPQADSQVNSQVNSQNPQSNGDYYSNGHASGVAKPVTSASYQAGLQIGHSSAVAISQWSRSVAQSPAQQSFDCAIGSELQEHLDGVAEGAQVEVALLAAAVADPTRVVGNCDLLLDVPPPEPNVAGRVRGFAMTFTRHIQLDHLSFHGDALNGCLVTATGMPGAVVGWNDAGMLAIVGPHASEQSALSPGMPVGQVIQQIAQKCRSFADVRQLVDSGDLERPPAGMSVLVADLSAGGIHEITPRGEVHDRGHQMVSHNRISPLARILMEGHSQNPAEALVELATKNSAAALSAACSWLAITIEGQQATVAAGSPTGSLQCGQNFNLPLIALEPQREAIPTPLEIPADAVTCRYLLEMRPLGPPRAARTFQGERVLLLGGGALAEPLVQSIRRAGGNVETAECKNREQAIGAITAAESRGAVHHLVLLARDPDGKCLAWPAGKEARVESMFFATQQWLTAREAAGDLATASLTALVDLGGDFGLSGHVARVEGGAICGLLKNLNREYPEAHVRVVDAVSQLPAEVLCERFVAEMNDAAGPVEIGLSTSGRHVAAVRHEELAGPASHLPEALQRGRVWMVTGGARGVTAACAQQLAARYGVTLALVGSTQPVEIDPAWLALDADGLKQFKGETMVAAKNRGDDPRTAWGIIEKSLEIHHSLAALSAAGAAAHYEVCDLANEAQVKQLVNRVAHNLGPVRGLIHGAGYEASCRFSKKTPEGLAATLGPKCDGLAHLLAALHDTPLSQVVAFGSTSGRFGGHGQADYSAANDLLAKQVADARRRTGLAATVIHWHAWGGAGMANRPESRFVLEQFGLQFMPLTEGATRLLAEMEAGLPHAEVVITEPKMCAGAIAWPEADRQSAAENHIAVQSVDQAPPPGSLVAAVEHTGGEASVAFELDPTKDCFLREHKQLGRPLLPAVMGLELMAQAAVAAGQLEQVQEIRNFVVERPVVFPVEIARTFRVASQYETNGVAAQLMGRHMRTDGRVAENERVHVRGELSAVRSSDEVVPLGDRLFPFNPMVYQDDGLMWHGPAFRTLLGLFYERSGGWGKLKAPDMNILAAPRTAAGWTVPAALLDGCTYASAVYSYLMLGKRVELPVAFDRLRFFDNPQVDEECVVRILYKTHSEKETQYDFTLYGADNRVLLSIDTLHLAVIMQGR